MFHLVSSFPLMFLNKRCKTRTFFINLNRAFHLSAFPNFRISFFWIMFVFKRGCIVVLVVFQLIFLDRTCHSQFHWGKNYEMEADNLRALLQRYASNQVQKTLENVPKVMFFFKMEYPFFWREDNTKIRSEIIISFLGGHYDGL